MSRHHSPGKKSTPHAEDELTDDRDHQVIDEALAQPMGADNFAGQPGTAAGSRNDVSSPEDPRVALVEAQKRTLMVQAELENFRKRIRREHTEQLRYASLPLIKDLLPALDNFQRAMESSTADATGANMVEGIAMVHRMLLDVLKQHGCEQVGAAGEEFDPNLHEAVAQQADSTVPAGHILMVTQNGYRLYDRIVRPTQVIVSSGPPNA